jgi:predicted transcriptional regulator
MAPLKFLLGRRPVGLDGLGSLERRVMETIWRRRRPTSVRDLLREFGGWPAYTTLMTTTDRLFKKGLLDRRREGRAFLYTPLVSDTEMRWRPTAALLEALLRMDPRPVLSFFVEAVSSQDRELLGELERLVRERRGARTPTKKAR